MTEPDELLTQAIAALRDSRVEQAAPLLDAVLAQAPDHPLTNALRGAVSLSLGDSAGALRHFEKAADAHADDPGFNQNYATALLASGDPQAAEDRARRTLAAATDNTAALLILARSLRAQERESDALPLLLQLAADHPGVSVCNEAGLCLMELDRPDEAEAAFRQASEFDPAAYEPWHNLGNSALDQHRPDDAIAAFDRVLRSFPDHPQSHVHRAQALLLSGRYAEGWDAYEWRWRLPNRLSLRDSLATSEWNGAAVDGRRLLVYAEQGFGDAIQFARFLPLVAERGAKVTLDVPPALYRLFASQGGGFEVSRQDAPAPPHDLRIAMMSLPRVLGITLENLPAPAAYLRAPTDGAAWRARLAGGGRKVGLAWRAFAERRGSAHRSVPLTALAPLFDIPDISWISLQKETPPDDLPLPAGLQDLSGDIGDFADTATLISELDLVITVDTAVAHLAGALGVPVWIMLPRGGDWRWLMNRTDSPWYPTARLYRQGDDRTWGAVAAVVARDLEARAP